MYRPVLTRHLPLSRQFTKNINVQVSAVLQCVSSSYLVLLIFWRDTVISFVETSIQECLSANQLVAMTISTTHACCCFLSTSQLTFRSTRASDIVRFGLTYLGSSVGNILFRNDLMAYAIKPLTVNSLLKYKYTETFLF